MSRGTSPGVEWGTNTKMHIPFPLFFAICWNPSYVPSGPSTICTYLSNSQLTNYFISDPSNWWLTPIRHSSWFFVPLYLNQVNNPFTLDFQTFTTRRFRSVYSLVGVTSKTTMWPSLAPLDRHHRDHSNRPISVLNQLQTLDALPPTQNLRHVTRNSSLHHRRQRQGSTHQHLMISSALNESIENQIERLSTSRDPDDMASSVPRVENALAPTVSRQISTSPAFTATRQSMWRAASAWSGRARTTSSTTRRCPFSEQCPTSRPVATAARSAPCAGPSSARPA